MALTASERQGTVVPGFITDEDGRLVITTTPDEEVFGEIVAGYVTDTDGRLVVTYGA